jgi:hypothetical protein
MPFEALGEDVLLKTLAMCDIYTALTISMVCGCTIWGTEQALRHRFYYRLTNVSDKSH